MKITNPKLEVVRFNADDVIATSLFIMRASEYNSLYGTDFTSNYVQFNGSIVTTSGKSGVWGIENVHAAEEAIDDEVAELSDPFFVNYIKSFAAMTYEAYKDDDDTICTKGVSYWERYGKQ